ncbi:IS110 family transposase [Streptomyces europaeiscabiei]|uniref:IS110 family transposase n=1 Tax=Streptomyces europaeiscabiei TaxID=146819 RepID=UPI0029BDCA1E|nr:transposase [Streptomyces europaeiscabiei]MDX3839523.1 transposase [Streptomyces europaeiscabiei]
MQTSEQPRSGHVVIGVDTHKHVHVAAVMDTIGGILATLTIPTDTGGFQQLADWAASFGRILAFGIEGTGSYGATLTSFLRPVRAHPTHAAPPAPAGPVLAGSRSFALPRHGREGGW